MPTPILMPALSPTMTEGTIARWLKKEGDPVAPGDVLAEIETDKATMEVEAVDEGRIGSILVAAGTTGVKVNEPIAMLLIEGESAGAPAPTPAPVAAPVPAATAASIVVPTAPAAAAPAVVSGDRVIASPLARRMAQLGGVDLSTIKGTGPNGRIVKSDVEAASAAPKPAIAAAASTPTPIPAAPAPVATPAEMPGLPAFELVPHTTMRRVIARRLTESKATVPHFYLSVDVALDALLKLRGDLNKRGEAGGFKLSVNDFVIRASALALKRKPAANASWRDDGIMMFKTADVSVAVAIPGGLITPIIREADRKGLAEISNEMKDLAARAKDGKLKPEEFQGGTFSVSNLGMFGIKDFSAIINPPQAAILAVGAGEQRAVVKSGAVAIETQMTVTLSVDHRVIDGALGAEFLQVFKGLIEDPLSMLL